MLPGGLRISELNINENIEEALGINEESRELAELLTNLKLEQGMMVGIFGRWGRGKTFLWKKTWSYFQKLRTVPFYKVEFQAWKYQDAPASWAYLYESILHNYVLSNRSGKVTKWLDATNKIIKLNYKRKGYLPLLKFTFLLLLGVFSFFLIRQLPLKETPKLKELVFYLGLPITSILTVYQLMAYVKKEYSSEVKDIIGKYTQKHTFSSQLGLQAEIQKEILILLKSWIPNKDVSKKRILIFVDDLDRCSETKIIQLIDALRVMLDDIEIAQRVVVLCAIDERILKLAISNKYYDLLSKDYNSKDESKKINCAFLVREYMDKLFIAGIRLKNLNSEERLEILAAITKGKVNFNNLQDEHTKTNFITVDTQDQINKSKKALTDDYKYIDGKRDYELEHFEYKWLTDLIRNDLNSTPRMIRIFYYRYLLAKRLMSYKLRINPEFEYQWDRETDKAVLPYMILQYSTNRFSENLYKDFEDDILDNKDPVNLLLFSKRFEVRRTVFFEVLKIIDTVVPY